MEYKKRGRLLLLGADLDMKIQAYLKKVRDGGGAISSRIIFAATRGILLKCDRTCLSEFGGPVTLIRPWACSLLQRMHFVKRKVTMEKSSEDFDKLKLDFLHDAATTVAMEDIPPDLILN